MASAAFPMSDIVVVNVNAATQSAVSPSFNQGLIVGTSTVVPSVGANSRIQQFNSTTSMQQAGFAATSPEFIAAQLYFGQAQPAQTLFVGRQDLTALSSVTGAVTVAVGGENYAVGDVIIITQVGASFGAVMVTTIGTGGTVTGLEVVSGSQGTGYSAATGLATTGGTGTGLTINIVSVGESAVEAVTACRTANSAFYSVYVCGAAKADHLAIAEFVQGASPATTYFFNTSDPDVPNGTAGNVFLTLQSEQFTRTFGVYSTTLAGNAPNNAFAGAAVMGVAMGLFTGLPNSYFTLKFKQAIGVAAETTLTATQRTNIETANGNLVLGFGNGNTASFTSLEQGTMSSGIFFDQVIGRDFLSSNIQFNVVSLLASSNAVPLTNPGVQSVLNTVSAAALISASAGFISTGTWNGQSLSDSSGKVFLTPGTALPTGYLAQAASVASLTQAQIGARQCPPVILAIIETQAIHSVTVQVNVQL